VRKELRLHPPERKGLLELEPRGLPRTIRGLYSTSSKKAGIGEKDAYRPKKTPGEEKRKILSYPLVNNYLGQG